MRWIYGLMTVAGLLSVTGETQAQFNPNQSNVPGYAQPQQQFAPNFYNRSNQPLNPYLNLFRNSNPAVNFYYGVRPGLPSGGATPNSTTPNGNFNAFGPRQTFVPQTDSLGQLEDPAFGFNQAQVPPTGHPITFNNSLGYYPGFGGIGQNRQQQQGGAPTVGRQAGIGSTPRTPSAGPTPPRN